MISNNSLVFAITNIKPGRFTNITVNPSCGQNNNYQFGQKVILNIPTEWGMQELHGKIGHVVERFPENPNRFSIDIDSSRFASFNPPPFYSLNPPTVCLAWDTAPKPTSNLKNSPLERKRFFAPVMGGTFFAAN